MEIAFTEEEFSNYEIVRGIVLSSNCSAVIFS